MCPSLSTESLCWASDYRLPRNLFQRREGWGTHSIQWRARPSGHWLVGKHSWFHGIGFLKWISPVWNWLYGCGREGAGRRQAACSVRWASISLPRPQCGGPGTGVVKYGAYEVASSADRRASAVEALVLLPKGCEPLEGQGPW